MKYLNMLIGIICSTVKLLLKKLFGCRIKFGMVNLISPFSHLITENKGRIAIGNKTGIRSGVEVKANGGTIVIGDNCFINRNSMIIAHENINIADGTTIGPNVLIYDHDHNLEYVCVGGYKSMPILIGKNVWIGAGSIILKGVTIGNDCVVAAGSVVTASMPDNTILIQKRISEMRERRKPLEK